jgi:hypothetical protein
VLIIAKNIQIPSVLRGEKGVDFGVRIIAKCAHPWGEGLESAIQDSAKRWSDGQGEGLGMILAAVQTRGCGLTRAGGEYNFHQG